MGQRTRRRDPAARRGRDEALRAGLEPVAPGERPRAVTVAAVVAGVLAAAVLVGALTGRDLSAKGGSKAGGVGLAAMLLVAAWGMWRTRYWAVLGFEAYLGFQILVTALALTVASSWYGAALCVTIIGLSGWLFWKLIRAMARLQMPRRPVS